MTKIMVYVFFSWTLSQTACIQKHQEAKSCYSSDGSGNERVYDTVLKKPRYKGGQDSLANFISSNIKLEKFNSATANNDNFLDTARIKFIVNGGGGISQLSITTFGKEDFAEEVTRIIKKSSCEWLPGENEDVVDSWHQFDLYFSVKYDNSDNAVQTTITVNEF